MRGLWGRLSTRLVVSHLLVAVLGGLATALVVRMLAPTLFDRTLQGMGRGMGGMTSGTLRSEFARSVDSALVVGTIVGIVVAAAAGAWAAYRLLAPLQDLRAAAADLAAGHYDTRVPLPQERELADLAADVNALGATLAETETRRVRLLGEVAHELRTPLTVVEGYVEGMIDGVLSTGPDDLAKVGEEVRRMRRLADDLSALSRADEGRLELQRVDADLAAVAAAAAERLRPQAEDAGVTLLVDTGPEALRARLDPDRIAQVVTNLVGNALHATPAGGRVTVSCGRHGSAGEVVVADTGVGLAAPDVERVFERFFRAGSQASRRDQGSGIGLTIARDLARAHGGTLTAVSDGPGLGASFTLRVPLR
ncbi:sensor histidine kinase [Nocardioides sp.]|uniref:sensor histidine kinase n=1 Tax=Nocardioides sp. TaxID=35761 RepID=UPI003527FE38